MKVYHFLLDRMPTQEERRAIAAVPGVRLLGREVRTPEHAGWIVQNVLQKCGLRPTYKLIGAGSTTRYTTPAQIPELRAFTPDFLTTYQRDFLTLSTERDAISAWWSTGCLTGDTKIIVNRGRAARSMELATVVARLQGKTTRNLRNGKTRRWDLSIPTYSQSIDVEGYVRLNEIVRVYENGVKPVFRLTTRTGRTIKATGEHRFAVTLATNGEIAWTQLHDLHVGAHVLVAEWPKRAHVTTRKLYYRYQAHMWNHPRAMIKNPTRGAQSAEVAEHRLIMEAHLNGLAYETYIGRILLGRTEGLRFLTPEEQVHHRDRNTINNCFDNLELLTGVEHQRRHGEESHWKHVTSRVHPDEIVAIEELPPEPVYDLGMAEPRPHYVANEFVVHNSGKACALICWALLDDGLAVLVTRASARRTLAAEIKKFVDVEKYPHCVPIVIEGQKPVEVPHHSRFVIVGYEVLPYHYERLIKLGPSVVGYDEIHHAKSHKRWDCEPDAHTGKPTFKKKKNVAVACMELSRAKSVKRRAGFTATPIANRLSDLWAQLDLIEPGAWGNSFYDFARRHCDLRKNKWGGFIFDGRANVEELDGRLHFVVHAVPQSVTHAALPPKRRQVIYVEQDDLNAPGEDFKEQMRSAAARGVHAITEVRLAEAASMKREFVLDTVLNDAVENIKQVVFTGRRHDAEVFARELKKLAPDLSIFLTHGGYSHAERDQAQREYMAHPGPAVFVATGQSAGTAINLQDTDIFNGVMLPWRPADVRQWEGRVYRLGGVRKVLLRWFVAKQTYDEAVANKLLDKLPAVEKVVGDEELVGFSQDLHGVADEEKLIEELVTLIGKAPFDELEQLG